MRTKLFLPGPKEFRQWRLELGLTEEEMAEKAGITVEDYRFLESPQAVGNEAYGKVAVAFRELGKHALTVEGHSTLQ